MVRRRAPFETLAMLLMLRARAVSNHEVGPCVPTSFFETHRTVGKRRLCEAPQDEVGYKGQSSFAEGAHCRFDLRFAAKRLLKFSST